MSSYIISACCYYKLQKLVQLNQNATHDVYILQIPDKYPHWMQNPNRPSYESQKLLGKMFDRVQQHPINKKLQELLLLQDNNP